MFPFVTEVISSSAPIINDQSPGIDSPCTNRPGPPNNDNKSSTNSSFDLSDLKLATLRAELMEEVPVTKNSPPDTKYSNLTNDVMCREDSPPLVSMPQFNEREEQEDIPNDLSSRFSLDEDDNVFDAIDKGGMSKGAKMNDELEIHEEEVETEKHDEEIVFRGLTPLCCDLVLGNGDIIGPLSRKYTHLLNDTIKLIKSTFGKIYN